MKAHKSSAIEKHSTAIIIIASIITLVLLAWFSGVLPYAL